MQKTFLIHNSRCSKSREAKVILEESGIEFVTIEYLKDGLKEKLLEELPNFLNLPYEMMIRKNEEIYKELELDKKSPSQKEWIRILTLHPILLERPIFIRDEKAVIGRPPSVVRELL